MSRQPLVFIKFADFCLLSISANKATDHTERSRFFWFFRSGAMIEGQISNPVFWNYKSWESKGTPPPMPPPPKKWPALLRSYENPLVSLKNAFFSGLVSPRPLHWHIYLIKSSLKRRGGCWKLASGETPWYLAVSENSGFSPQIIHFYRGFHYFHHPFWGTPIFWKHPFTLRYQLT